MNGYAIYRISETIRVLFFITLSIVAFNFYPVTAIMIVLLALLNDFAIMSIAYDRAEYSSQPDRWRMSSVMGMALYLGLIGTVVSFGLLFFGLDYLHLNKEILQSFMYLQLSVAGHLTIFIARTRGHFWSYPPGKLLVGAVVGTQIVATLIAVYGFLIPPIGWNLAAMVWAYALVTFLIVDQLKVRFFKLFDEGLRFMEDRFNLD